MTKVTVFNENLQETSGDDVVNLVHYETEDYREFLLNSAGKITKVHPQGIHMTLKSIFDECDDMAVRTVTMDMPEFGFSQEVLDDTDVLVLWAHLAHEKITDEIAERIKNRVHEGMGFLCLHSAHQCKPLHKLIGVSTIPKWRMEDACKIYCIEPNHPIAKDIPDMFELEAEQVYCEPFDITTPDELVFVTWYQGGELLRSGCCWERENGRIFYFQPGHETCKSYYDVNVRQILKNAVRWASHTA